MSPAFSFSTHSLFYSDHCGISPWRPFLSRDHLHLSGCNGINNICNYRIKMIYKVIDWDPREGGCGRKSLNKYFTGVFSDIPLCDYFCLNICVHRDSTLQKAQEWSERATSVTTTLEMFRPLEIIKSRVSPLLCVCVWALSHAESVHSSQEHNTVL